MGQGGYNKGGIMIRTDSGLGARSDKFGVFEWDDHHRE
jgi:hypothetical protein